MIFTPADIDAFCAISGDTNPLHADDEFARHSGFEGRVVPGMLSVITALQHLPVVPRTLRCKFAEPLYAGVEYPFSFNLSHDRLWYGGDDKKAIAWLNGTVFTSNYEVGPEQNAATGEYSTTEPASWQMLVLYWVSWFVGTHTPGAGAILASAEIDFVNMDNPLVPHLAYAVRNVERNDVLGMVSMEAVLKGKAAAYCSIMAFLPRGT